MTEVIEENLTGEWYHKYSGLSNEFLFLVRLFFREAISKNYPIYNAASQ